MKLNNLDNWLWLKWLSMLDSSDIVHFIPDPIILCVRADVHQKSSDSCQGSRFWILRTMAYKLKGKLHCECMSPKLNLSLAASALFTYSALWRREAGTVGGWHHDTSARRRQRKIDKDKGELWELSSGRVIRLFRAWDWSKCPKGSCQRDSSHVKGKDNPKLKGKLEQQRAQRESWGCIFSDPSARRRVKSSAALACQTSKVS